MSLSTINVLIFLPLSGLMAFGLETGNGCPATRDVPLPYGLLADEVSDVMAMECETESEWTFHSEIGFCREHVPVLPFATGHALGFVACDSEAVDLDVKLVKTKLLDLDADYPHASVLDLVGVGCVSKDADRDLKMSRAPEVFPGAWMRAESNPKLQALISELDHEHRSYLAFVNGDRQRL